MEFAKPNMFYVFLILVKLYEFNVFLTEAITYIYGDTLLIDIIDQLTYLLTDLIFYVIQNSCF